jgi:carbonic anhydrase/acetyltransferase-like protein (isoleucine patch superfamily)
VLIEHEGRRPRVDPSAYVAPTAVLSGDVRVGEGCRVLFGAVLTDDGGRVELGKCCTVMENALLRGRAGHPVVVGGNVIVGPHAHLNGARVGADAFIATGVSIFPGASVGAGAEVRIGGVVHVKARSRTRVWSRSDGSRSVTPPRCSPRTGTTTSGRSSGRSTSPAPSSGRGSLRRSPAATRSSSQGTAPTACSTRRKRRPGHRAQRGRRPSAVVRGRCASAPACLVDHGAVVAGSSPPLELGRRCSSWRRPARRRGAFTETTRSVTPTWPRSGGGRSY